MSSEKLIYALAPPVMVHSVAVGVGVAFGCKLEKE